MREITNTEDIIDSRDVIERIEELQAQAEVEPLDEWEASELANLLLLAEEGESLSDWAYGETLIRDSYFEDYAQELAEEVCEMPRDYQWPFSHIDWEAAADALRQDYTEITFGDATYWARG